ncbi:MAG TPA: hypothetical protein VIK61_12035 [Acidimicrobiia bacterium]
MTSDLLTRLGAYGTTLDREAAADLERRPTESNASDLDQPFLDKPFVVDTTPAARERGPRRVLIPAAVLIGIVVLSLTIATQIRGRRATPGGANGRAFWPMVLAPGLVPWFEAGHLPAGASKPVAGPQQHFLYCKTWTVVSTTVRCTALEGEAFLPQVKYHGSGWTLAVYTGHLDSSVHDYATQLAHRLGGDFGAPLPTPQPATVAGANGWLSVDGKHLLVVWPVKPGLQVALDTKGLSRDQLFSIAAALHPTAASVRDIPLVLAHGDDPAYPKSALALGHVRGGQLCIIGVDPQGCLGLVPPRFDAVASSGAGATIGLVDPKVASIEFVFRAGPSVTITPTPSPLPGPRAFAELRRDHLPWNPISLVLRGRDGEFLLRVAFATMPTPPATATPASPATSTPTTNT